MTTSLGGAKDAGFRIHVRNNSALGPLKRGTVVALNVAASNPQVQFLDLTQPKDYGVGTVRQTDIPYISVQITEAAESTTLGARSRLGVVMADIPPLGFGEVCVYGICQCIVAINVVQGEVITALLGAVQDAANATDKNPMGIALETSAVVGSLAWCFVNCLGWTGAATAFGGKPY